MQMQILIPWPEDLFTDTIEDSDVGSIVSCESCTPTVGRLLRLLPSFTSSDISLTSNVSSPYALLHGN